MNAYVDVLGPVAMTRHSLSTWELRDIGEFTRDNIIKWLERRHGVSWIGCLPVGDIHAVCGDLEIPWAAETSKRSFQRIQQPNLPVFVIHADD